jgi:Icc protein
MRKFASVLRVLQLSDCHVSAGADADYRGQSADRNLASLLPEIRRWQPDLILLTGDVSEDGSAAAYGRVFAKLNSTGAPVLALPGNHDEPAVMRRYFPQGPWDAPLVRDAKGWKLVLLNSTVPQEVSGRLSAESLERLDLALRQGSSKSALVALHHQPVPVQSPWIDRYPLQNPEDLFAVLNRHAGVRCITWGHVHQDFQATRGNMHLLGSPSTVANSLPEKESFTLDLGGPAGRWLELHADGRIETGCLRAA